MYSGANGMCMLILGLIGGLSYKLVELIRIKSKRITFAR